MSPAIKPLTLIAPPPRGSARLFASRDPALYESLESLVFGAAAPRSRPERERRATERVQAEVLYEERVGGRRWYRLTWDLSTFGLSTQEGPRHAEGTQLSLTLHLPDELTGPIALTAEVLGVHAATGGMRLAFRSPPAVSARRLHQYLFGRGRGARAALPRARGSAMLDA